MNSQDRNFDDLTDHFSKRIYGSLKGRLREAVIQKDLAELTHFLSMSEISSVSDIFDLGAGLGRFTIQLAKLKHRVVYSDISQKMTEKARQDAMDAGVLPKVNVQILQVAP